MACFATPYGLRYAAHCFNRADAQNNRPALIPAGGKLGVTSLSFRGEVYAQYAQYFSNLANTIAPGTKLPNYAFVNVALEWKEVMGAPIDLTIFIKNAFPKDYFSDGFAFAPLGTVAAIPGEPRMFGMSAKHKF